MHRVLLPDTFGRAQFPSHTLVCQVGRLMRQQCLANRPPNTLFRTTANKQYYIDVGVVLRAKENNNKNQAQKSAKRANVGFRLLERNKRRAAP